MPDYILGLDLGPNSIGWALVEAQPEETGGLRPVGLLDTAHAGHPPLGVRIFEAGLARTPQGKEYSRNDARRDARATRRTLSRRKARKRKTRAVLQQAGLLPKEDEALAELMARDPYELRAKALHQRLDDYELGRALYHLAQRRGFKSNRVGDDAKESSELKQEISALMKLIDDSSSLTLGEYLHDQRDVATGSLPPRMRQRFARLDLYADAPRRTSRSMYQQEFELVLDRQKDFRGTPVLTPELHERLSCALFFQYGYALTEERIKKAPKRANLHRAPGVRPCPFERGQTGCPRSNWLAQRFRIIKDVRSLRVSLGGEPERELTQEESAFLIEDLSLVKKRTFAALAKAAAKKFHWPHPIAFNLARGGRKDLAGNEVDATLRSAFGKKAWLELSAEAREHIRSALAEQADPSALKATLQGLGLKDTDKLETLIKFSPKTNGYLSYSLRALEKIVPKMERGMDEYDAVQSVYGLTKDTANVSAFGTLPSLAALCQDRRVQRKAPPEILTKIQTLTNPKVQRALVEVRKVVNAIIREHGMPKRIVVEMAREVRQGRSQRDAASQRRRAREARRKKAVESVRELCGSVAHGDVDRWLYWDEQNHRCPYCLNPISAQAAFSAETEVDHILPRSRSLDDSRMNKVLCHSHCNAAKGNRTPVEWRGVDSEEHQSMMDSLWEEVSRDGGDGKMPYAKVKRMEVEELDPDSFASRQLNDTAYISKLVSQYLLLLYPYDEHVGQRRVITSRGSLTAHLRRLWGLNGLMEPLVKAHGEVHRGFEKEVGRAEKSRMDHRHHAVDALVVALSSRAFTKRLQDHWQAIDQPNGRVPEFPQPWEGLRRSVEDAVGRIQVSHRPQRRVRGGLHEKTFYGKVQGHKDKYVTRKRLEELTPKMLTKIVAPDARHSIEKRLRSCGWDGKSPLKSLKDSTGAPWWNEPVLLERCPRLGRAPQKVRKARPIFRVRIHETKSDPVQLGEQGHRFASTGSNHCLHVVDTEAGPHPSFFVVPRFNAQRGPASLPAEASVMGTLHRKDSVLVEVEGLDRAVLGVVQVISGSPTVDRTTDIVIRDARDSRPGAIADKDPILRLRSSGGWNRAKVLAVDIDPLGRIQCERVIYAVDP